MVLGLHNVRAMTGPTQNGRSSARPTLDAFRAELRTWLESHLTPEVVEAGPEPIETNLELLRAWNRTLADGGWAAPSWPVEFGGRGAGVMEQLAYLEEMNRARAPGPVNVIGVSNIAPAIMQFGTPQQQERFLQPMLRGDEIWSQGMSEPDAGSDLASLRTAAVEDGDHFVVNGQKTWNSLGHLADWCQLYVRTDPTAKKHNGITCFLVDLRTPGIEARPLTTITGGQTFAELFFTDARIPRSAMLGDLHQGWSVAMTTLSFERAGVARLHLSLSNRLDDLLADPRTRGALRDPLLRQRLSRTFAAIRCMRYLTERSLADPIGGRDRVEAWPSSPGLTATRSWPPWPSISSGSMPSARKTVGPRISSVYVKPRSPAAPPRSTRTSLASTCSACPGRRSRCPARTRCPDRHRGTMCQTPRTPSAANRREGNVNRGVHGPRPHRRRVLSDTGGPG